MELILLTRGLQDAYALLLAAHHPRAKLVGVSTVHGNSSLDNTTYNTCAVLEALGRSDVPVVRGAAKPLQRDAVHAPQYHGATGLDGVSLLPVPKHYRPKDLPSGMEAVHSLMMQEPQESIVIVATGPLTNVAQLLLSFPDVVSVVSGISVMGGAVGDGYTTAPMHRQDGPGNWSQWAEFNIFCDPEAANMVLKHPKLRTKSYMATLDLTHLCRADENVFAQIFASESSSSRVSQMMEEVMVYFRDSYRKHTNGATDGPPLHDAVAVFFVLESASILDLGAKGGSVVHVETEGEQTGRTVLVEGAAAQGVIVPRAIDLERFWKTITECLRSAAGASPL